MEFNKEKGKFFGESVFFEESERLEAKQYLESWKKFLLRNLVKDSYDVLVKDEQWGESPPQCSGIVSLRSGMYLKLYIEADWHYELGKVK